MGNADKDENLNASKLVKIMRTRITEKTIVFFLIPRNNDLLNNNVIQAEIQLDRTPFQDRGEISNVRSFHSKKNFEAAKNHNVTRKIILNPRKR